MLTTIHNSAHGFLRVALTWGVACLAGCSSLALPNPVGWTSLGTEKEIPTRVVVVWTDTIMNQPGQRGVRGVGGRLVFYGAHDELPVQVRGTLTVYAYDDSEAIEPGVAPARKFVFLPDQLANHHSTSKGGSSYDVWLPWNEVGNPERQLTLIARFEPENGAVVMTDPARQLLPGTVNSTKVKNSTLSAAAYHDQPQRSHLDLASYEPSSAAGPCDQCAPEAADPLGTFTIDLPANVARRWHAQVADTLDQSPARAAARSAAVDTSATVARRPAGAEAALPLPRRVESAADARARPRRLNSPELPSRLIRRPASNKTSSAAPTEVR